MRRSIVIFTEGTLGDHLPFVAFGTALVRRGHRVQLVINSAMTSYAAATGTDVVPLPDAPLGVAEAQLAASDWNHWDAPRRRRRPLHGLPARETYYVDKVRLLKDLCAGADLFISTSIRDFPWVVAELTGVPWITVSLNPAHYARRANIRSDPAHPVHRRIVARSRAVARYLYRALDRPVPRLPESWYGFRAPITLLGASPAFSRPCAKGMGRGTRLIATGFWFYENPSWASWTPNAALRRICEGPQRPLVLAMSSQPVEDPRRLLGVHVEAASRLDRSLVVQRGWAGFSEDDVPESMRRHVVFADFMPQDWIFARAACAIQHGGPGSIARALVEGCPVLVEPFGNDQFFNALRVVRLRVGAAVHPLHVTADTIARVLRRRLLQPACRARAAAIGALIRREDGINTACDVVERVLSGAAP